MIQKKIRVFLEKKRIEKEKKLKMMLEEEKKLEKAKENLKHRGTITKEQSNLYDEAPFESLTMIEDEWEEGRPKKTIIKKFQSYKINNFIPFMFQWKSPLSSVDYLIFQSTNIMFNIKNKSCVLDFFFLINKEFLNMRLIIHKINEKELSSRKNCWLVFTFLINLWLEENTLVSELAKFQGQKNHFLIYFDKILLKEEDLEDFFAFKDLLSFFVSISFVKLRKIIGSCWKCVDLQENQEISSNNQRLDQILQEKQRKIKLISCRLEPIRSGLYSHLGYEKKITSLDPTIDYQTFFRNFRIPLKKVLLKKANLLEKFASLRNLTGKKTSLNNLVRWSQRPLKNESLENMLQVLNEKNDQSENKRSISHSENLESSIKNLSNNSKEDLNPKKNSEHAETSKNTSEINSRQDLNISSLKETLANPKFPSMVINEKPGTNSIRFSMSTQHENNKNRKKIVRKSSRRKLFQLGFKKVEPHKDLYMNDKPYIIKEDDELEKYEAITFP